jgi:hypothetical protein
MEEKRQYPRIRLENRKALFAGAASDEAGLGKVANLSRGGVLIETAEACLKWLNVNVVVHLSGTGIMAEGRVVRHYPKGYLAIKFSSVHNPDALQKLCIGGGQ